MDRQELRSLAHARGGINVGKKVLWWNQAELAADSASAAVEDGVAEDEEQYIRDLSEDYFFWEESWDYMLEQLEALMHKVNPDCDSWYCEVDNFGWQSQAGFKYFSAKDGSEFLKAVLPDTDNTFNIYKTENGLAINNFHHDSGFGKEWYYLYPNRPQEAVIVIPESDLKVVTEYANAMLQGRPAKVAEDKTMLEYRADFDGHGNWEAIFCLFASSSYGTEARLFFQQKGVKDMWHIPCDEWHHEYPYPYYAEEEVNEALFTCEIEQDGACTPLSTRHPCYGKDADHVC